MSCRGSVDRRAESRATGSAGSDICPEFIGLVQPGHAPPSTEYTFNISHDIRGSELCFEVATITYTRKVHSLPASCAFLHLVNPQAGGWYDTPAALDTNIWYKLDTTYQHRHFWYISVSNHNHLVCMCHFCMPRYRNQQSNGPMPDTDAIRSLLH